MHNAVPMQVLKIDISTEIAALTGPLRRDWGQLHGADLNDALAAAKAPHSERRLLSRKARQFPMLAKG